MAVRTIVPVVFASALAAWASDWPQFLGPARDGTYPASDSVISLRSPRMLWKKDVGSGFSSPVVADGKLILFHRAGNDEVVEGLDAATGERIWRFAYATGYRDDFGFDEGPRGTPAVSGGRVYTFGAEGFFTRSISLPARDAGASTRIRGSECGRDTSVQRRHRLLKAGRFTLT